MFLAASGFVGHAFRRSDCPYTTIIESRIKRAAKIYLSVAIVDGVKYKSVRLTMKTW